MNCKYCNKPKATSKDYEEIAPGEGEHLCWRERNRACVDVETALDRSIAENEKLKSIARNLFMERIMEVRIFDCVNGTTLFKLDLPVSEIEDYVTLVKSYGVVGKNDKDYKFNDAKLSDTGFIIYVQDEE